MADNLEKMLFYFKSFLEPYGFEVYPFLIDWYNKLVDSRFHLSYPRFTLAYVVLSTPSMFEKNFIPFVKDLSEDDLLELSQDLIDRSVRAKLDEARQECTLINNKGIDLLFDYDMDHNRRPKILVQTAADVAGSVRLYQEMDVKGLDYTLPEKQKKLFPCALHPQYGGWFAIRGVYIFKDIINPLLEEPPRLEVLKSKEEILDLLMKYNTHWQDWSFRDVIEPIERYSELQKLYFQTVPKDRMSIIKQIREMEFVDEKNGGHAIEEASDVLQYEGIE